MRFRIPVMICLLACIVCIDSYALGHEEPRGSEHSVDTILFRIEQAYRAGEIDRETALLNKAYAIFEPEKLNTQFQWDGATPIKCATPVVLEIKSAWNELSTEAREILASYFERPSKQYTFSSPSGRFKIHYDTSGPHSVYLPYWDIDPSDGVPDYVNRCAEIFDSCWAMEIDTLGYDAPPSDGYIGGDEDRYDVYLQHYEGAYGVTMPESPSDQYPGRNDWSSFIYVDPTYDGFGYADRLDPLSVTAAHEFFHAIQFAYNTWAGIWVMEISSVWMEDVLYDDINDYLNYLDAFFPQPQVSLDDSEDGYHPYGSCVWAFYVTENFGIDIMRQVWEGIIDTSPLNAFNTVLGLYGTTWNEAFREFTVWNYLTGTRANGSHPHYEEAAAFPSVKLAKSYSVYPVLNSSVAHDDLPNHLASNYVRFSSDGSSGDLKIFFTGGGIFQWRTSIVVDSADWFTSTEMDLDAKTGFIRIPQWENKREAVLIPCITNTSGGPGSYSFTAVIVPSGKPDFEFVGADAFDVGGGNGDTYIDPGETVELVLCLTNYGLPATGISAILTTEDPEVSIEKDDASFGDIEENESGDNGPDPFLLSVDEGAELHKADCTLNLVSNGAADTAEVRFQLIIGHPEILLVDDDFEYFPKTFDVESYYRSSLDSINAIYDYWTIEHDGAPDSSHLRTFQTVIWFTGYATPALTSQDQEHLAAFLEGGGNLFITGQDIAFELQSSDFLSDYLHAQFMSDQSDQGIVYGVPGDPISGDILFFSTLGDPGANNQVSLDVIAPLDDASVVFTYPPPLYETAAVRYDGDYRVVFFSFGFEAIVKLPGDTEALRSQILNNVLSWLNFEPRKADVDANGQINVLDMVRTAHIILGIGPSPTEYELWAADCDGNGTINVLDVLGTANVILGIGTCEP